MTNLQFDNNTCAACCNIFDVSHSKTIDQINDHSRKVRDDHQQMMQGWNRFSTSRRSTTPKADISLIQQLSCM